MLKITAKSDVYSYGVVVLEVLTGKQPIDPTIPDGLHVVDWVRRQKGKGLSSVLDPALLGRSDTEVEEMLQVMGVALLCVSPMPDERPTMKDVAAMLREIRLEREEYAKVDELLLKGGGGGSTNNTTTAATTMTTSTSSTPPCLPGGSNSSSFSASVYPSSNKAKSPFD